MTERFINTCPTPYMTPLYDLEGKLAIVIDVLRATTTICTALSNGVKAIIPVRTIAECEAYRGQGYLLAGERGGDKLEGFDLGNSPLKMTPELVGGQSLVMTTTNGTQAIHAVKEAATVLIGSFLNIDALVQYILSTERDVLLMCAGRRGKLSAEDTLLAGALIERFIGNLVVADDAGLMAHSWYQAFSTDKAGYIKRMERYPYFVERNMLEEINYCLSENTLDVLPVFNGREIVKQ